jgi:hypothetical protein
MKARREKQSAVPEEELYVLGQDVTEWFAPATVPDSAVLSVELSFETFEHLDALCDAAGQTYREVITAALQAYPPFQEQVARAAQPPRRRPTRGKQTVAPAVSDAD